MGIMSCVKGNTRTIFNFSVLGFVIAVLWMFILWMMFNASDSTATRAVVGLFKVTCPFIATPLWNAGSGCVLIPFLNAALYGFVTWLVLAFRSNGERHSAELQP